MPTPSPKWVCTLILIAALVSSCSDSDVPPSGTPEIHRRFPPAATTGTAIQISGLRFGTDIGTVWVGGQRAKAVSWSTDQIVALTPATEANTCAGIHVETASGRHSKPVPFAYGAHDVWEPWSEAPAIGSVAEWTGTEMIVWGVGRTAVGARYNPATDTWIPMTQLGAPAFPQWSFYRSAWTGTEMIVWGGHFDGEKFAWHRGGGRYDPNTDSWRPLSYAGAPENAPGYSAVWLGDRLFVWGGGRTNYFGWSPTGPTGGLYDPITDTWAPVSTKDAPHPMLMGNSAVWDGSEVLIFGGYEYGIERGKAYAPAANRWRTLSVHDAPSPRSDHAAVWTGSRMLIWGGEYVQFDPEDWPFALSHSPFNDGFAYDPTSDTWSEISTRGAPTPRSSARTAWTGRELLVWGGWGYADVSAGGRYDPVADTWHTIAAHDGAPAQATAVWTGEELLVWGDRYGARYSPDTDRWAPMSSSSDTWSFFGRIASHWTGSEMLIWGQSHEGQPMGGRYQPATHTWLPVAKAPLPSPDVTVWTGTAMIAAGGNIWGSQQPTNAVAMYRPASDAWAMLTPLPEPRAQHEGVWTGAQFLVWGGRVQPYGDDVSTGASYDPFTDTWHATSVLGAPSARSFPAVTWTGSSMLVYGGSSAPGFRAINSGSRYFPEDDRWLPIPDGPADLSIASHGAWAGGRWVLAVGQAVPKGYRHAFLQFDPLLERWQRTDLTAEWDSYIAPPLVSTGSEVLAYYGVMANGSVGALAFDPVTRSIRRLGAGCANLVPAPTVSFAGNVAAWTGSAMLVWGPTGGMTYWP
jgi:N-acetylneuraminic acid mutarotase